MLIFLISNISRETQLAEELANPNCLDAPPVLFHPHTVVHIFFQNLLKQHLCSHAGGRGVTGRAVYSESLL